MDYVDEKKRELKHRTGRVMDRFQDTPDSALMNRYKNRLLSKCKGATIPTYLEQMWKYKNFIGTSLRVIRSEDVERYIAYLKENDKAIKVPYSAIYDFCKFLEGTNDVPKIFKRIDKLKREPRKDTEPLDFDTEIKPMIDCWHDSVRNKAVMSVLAESMLRAGEFLGLRVCDIDLSKRPSPIKIRMSKTPQGVNRPVFLFNSIPILKEWLNIHPLKSSDKFNEAPIFCTRGGRVMTAGTLRHIVDESAKRVGLRRKVYPHLFRHSRAYELAKYYRFAPQELMKAGGWKNSSMLDTYYQPKPEDIKEKLLNGHGIVSDFERKKKESLRERKLLLCACGQENSFDNVFCSKCGVILNIKKYEEEMSDKDSEIKKLEKKFEEFQAQMEKMIKAKYNP